MPQPKSRNSIGSPPIAELWSSNTIGSSGRDIGVDLKYETDQTETVVFLTDRFSLLSKL